MKRVGISDPFSERERKAVAMEKSVFATRLNPCYEELKWLYCELYHNDREAFDYFVQMLETQWNARKDALRAIDAVPGKTASGWWKP